MGCRQPDTSTAGDSTSAGTLQTTYSLDEDIGEMLLVGFRGTAIDSAATGDIVEAVRDYHVGSVILFDYDAPTGKRGRNITGAEQVRALCGQLRRLSPTLFIGIDQEGGYVSRLNSRYGFRRIPSAKRMHQLGEDSLRHYADLTGAMLQDLGIDLDFAPVADVDVNPDCPVIGRIERSFSADAAEVGRSCQVWIDAMAQRGVASCMKHFPGHGSAKGDTHKGLVDVSDTWRREELAPYRSLDARTTMVMTAHVVNRRLDPTGLPASLSPRITSLLRDTLGFSGVIVTDDLAMGAISSHYSLEQTLRLALEAGADLLCLSNNGSHYDTGLTAKAVGIIKGLVADGTVSAERIRQSADRVRALKAATASGK